MAKMLPIPNMHREFRINVIKNLHLLVNELEEAQQRISREIVEGSTIEEVVDARAGRERLNDRLNEFATTEALANVVQGSPQGVFETVSALEAAHPDGAQGVYVVTATGDFYFWDGTAWVSGGSYQSTEWLDVVTIQGELWEVE